MRSTAIRLIVDGMSILSQIAPRDADGLMSIDIATATAMASPPRSIDAIGGSVERGLHIADAERLIRTLLCGIGADEMAAAALEAAVDEYVDVWTPALHTMTRFELISVMVDLDDAIGQVAVAFTESAATRSVAMLGWQATARFVRPTFLDDDHLLEPTGAVIRLTGATSVSFTSAGRAERIRCYYDRLALVEQMLGPRPGTVTT